MKSLIAAAIALTATAALASAPSTPPATPRVDFAETASADAPVVGALASETITLPPLHIIAERPTGDRVVAMAPMVIVADRPTTVATASAFEVITLPAMHLTARPERAAATSIAAVIPAF